MFPRVWMLVNLLFFAVPIIMGIVAAFVAKRRGRTIWWGLGVGLLSFFGFLPGLILLIVLVVLPPEEATKTCPRCAEKVKVAAQVCRFCAHEFGSAPT